MALETVKSLTQVARDIALVLAEIDNAMWFDVFMQYTNKKSTQKHLTYIKDKNELSNNIRMMIRGREKVCSHYAC